jgi:hypothetical protein
MRNSTIIFLTCCILANTLPKKYIHAIFKINHLFEHYKHHQEEENDHHFVDFLKTHYFGEHHEDDHNDHDNLPFHDPNQQNLVQQIVPCLLPEAQIFVAFMSINPSFTEKRVRMFYQSWVSFQNYTFIWQPPEQRSYFA